MDEKEKIISTILNNTPVNENVIHSEWSYMDGVGGYLIRKDGEFFVCGDDGAQEKDRESYGRLEDLSLKELKKIYANIIEDSDLPKDIQRYPSKMPFSNFLKLFSWVCCYPVEAKVLKKKIL